LELLDWGSLPHHALWEEPIYLLPWGDSGSLIYSIFYDLLHYLPLLILKVISINWVIKLILFLDVEFDYQ